VGCIGGDADQGEGLQHINVCQSILISYLAGFSMFICYEWVTTLWKIEYSLAYKVILMFHRGNSTIMHLASWCSLTTYSSLIILH